MVKKKPNFGFLSQKFSCVLATGYEWCEEACALVALDKDWRRNGLFANGSSTSFADLHISGSGYTTKYVYPSVLGDDYELISEKRVIGARAEVEMSVSSDKHVLMAGLYGRCYDRDPEYVRGNFNHKPILVPDF